MGDYQTHLESLGYRVEILEEKDEASVLWGAHPHRWNVRVSIQTDSALITTAVVLPKEETKDRRGALLELINQANGEAHAQLCLSDDGDLYCHYLQLGAYERLRVGQALDLVEGVMRETVRRLHAALGSQPRRSV